MTGLRTAMKRYRRAPEELGILKRFPVPSVWTDAGGRCRIETMKTVALVGTCGHQNVVLGELAKAGGYSLVGAASVTSDDSIEKTLARNDFSRDARVFSSPEELFRQVHPDVAIVAPRFDHTAEVVQMAADAGAHIITEKPLAFSTEVLRSLWDTVVRAGVQCAAMLSNREHPVLAAACARIRAGAVGQVVLLNARKSYPWGTRPTWYADRSIYGGTIPWVGIHALDFLYAATGQEVQTVFARHANLGHPERPGCEDVCLLDMRLESGALASVSVDYFRPSGAPTYGDDWLRVVGTKGVLEAAMDRGECRLLVSGGAGEQELPLEEKRPSFSEWVRQLPERGECGPDARTRRAFLLTQAALVARESADTGRELGIPEAPWHE